MKKYNLTEEDYIYLYPFVTPEKIKDEFGEMSHSPRHIRRVYEKKNLMPVQDALDDFVTKSYAFADFNKTSEAWAGYVTLKVHEKSKEKLQNVWNKARRYEELVTDAFCDS